jgi:hypothetical protein
VQQNSEIELSQPQHPWNSGDVQPFTGCVSGLLFFHLLDLTVLNCYIIVLFCGNKTYSILSDIFSLTVKALRCWTSVQASCI